MSSLLDVYNQFVAAVAENQRDSYAYAGALAFISYDMILSFGQEVEYIWQSKMSVVSGLYVVVRYYGFLSLMWIFRTGSSGHLNVEYCQRYFVWKVGAIIPIFIFASDTILMLRIYAIYNRRMWILAVLAALVLGNFIATLWANLSLSRDLAAKVVTLPPPWRGCASSLPPLRFMLAAYVPNFALSLLFLALTVRKLVVNHQILYGQFTWKYLLRMDTVPPLLLAFVRDGSVFFALTTLASFLGVLILFIVHEGAVHAAILPWVLVLYSYSASHLVLDLRATALRGNMDRTWKETLSLQYSGVYHDHGS